MSEYSYKNHNILTLSQRVQVLREYDLQTSKPKIQTLANKYNVSFSQIKSILQNREAILNSFYVEGGDDVHEELHDEFLRKRQEKIEFLAKVMYEYVQRIMHLNIVVDDEKVLQKAIEVKECIAVVNFRPTLLWLDEFKKAYGIPSFDLETLRSKITVTERKSHGLTAFDLIAHVIRSEKKKPPKGKHDRSEHSSVAKSGLALPIQPPPLLLYANKVPDEIVYETISEEEDHQVAKTEITCNAASTKITTCSAQSSKTKPRQKKSQNNKRTCSFDSMGEIESLDEAFKHLRLLEEYAMLQDNFRAIGLLTQLEEVLKKPPKV